MLPRQIWSRLTITKLRLSGLPISDWEYPGYYMDYRLKKSNLDIIMYI